MNTITYESLLPIIKSEKVKGQHVYCDFSPSNSNEVVSSFARIKKEREQEAAAEPTLMNKVKDTVSGLMAKIMGSRPELDEDGDAINYTEKEKETAVVEAFLSVSSQFYWNADENSWVLMDQISPFVKQTIESPVTEMRDKEVLARMLVELVNVDGKIVGEELEFLASFINPELGTVVDLLKKPALTKTDFEESTLEVKRTMFLLAWAVILIDEELDSRERQKINQFAEMLDLPEPHINELMKMAQCYIIENAALQSFILKEEILTLAGKIDLSKEEAERCLDSYRKRKV